MIESHLLRKEERVPFAAEIRVEDFERSLAYYTEKLGFSLYRIDRKGKVAVVKLGKAFFLIMEQKGIAEKKGVGFFFRFTVSDVDRYYQDIVKRGAKTLGPPEMRPWGAKRFYAEDPDGFKLQFIPE